MTPVNDPLNAGDKAQDHPHMYSINIITRSSSRVCPMTSPLPGLCFIKCQHADRRTRLLSDTALGFARACTVYLTRYTQVRQQPGSSVSIVTWATSYTTEELGFDPRCGGGLPSAAHRAPHRTATWGQCSWGCWIVISISC